MKLIVVCVCALSIAGMTGCSNQQRVEAGNQANRAGHEIKQAAANVQKDLSDGSITLKVKSAMNASDKLNTSGINVDTANKVVHLKGAVSDASQKTLAERIARDTVGNDITVMSHLTVQVKPAAKKVK